MEFPVDLASSVLEFHDLFAQKRGDGFLETVEVAEDFRVIEGEPERFEGVIEADDAERATGGAGGAEDGEDIRGGAEADVPDDEFTGMRGETFRQAELADVEGLRFGDRADDGMEGFAMGNGMDAVDAARELDDSVGGGRHASFEPARNAESNAQKEILALNLAGQGQNFHWLQRQHGVTVNL